jgi:hypothetical protein
MEKQQQQELEMRAPHAGHAPGGAAGMAGGPPPEFGYGPGPSYPQQQYYPHQQQQQQQQPYYAPTAPAYYTTAYAPPPGVMGQSVVYVTQAQAPVAARALSTLTYDDLLPRYVAMDRAILGLAVTQMVLWFPLGFLFFVGLLPRRGRLHMGMGILFLILAMAAFCTLLAVTYSVCYWWSGYSYSYTCYAVPAYKTFAFIFVPYVALAAASIGVGSRHHALETCMRVHNPARFANEFPDRTSGTVTL